MRGARVLFREPDPTAHGDQADAVRSATSSVRYVSDSRHIWLAGRDHDLEATRLA
jgi:hypothetical protein